MKQGILLIMLAVAVTAVAQKEPVNIGVIPTPQRVEMGQGTLAAGSFTPRRNFVSEIEGAQNQHQAYRLQITPEGVTVTCVGNEGWGYALKTLDQLKKIYGDRVPCMTITDWPAYEFRGWLDDISRGPIPNRQFRRQTRSFSEQYKLNFGNYYTEHTLYNELMRKREINLKHKADRILSKKFLQISSYIIYIFSASHSTKALWTAMPISIPPRKRPTPFSVTR